MCELSFQSAALICLWDSFQDQSCLESTSDYESVCFGQTDVSRTARCSHCDCVRPFQPAVNPSIFGVSDTLHKDSGIPGDSLGFKRAHVR